MLNLNPFTTHQTLHVNPTKEERRLTNGPFLTIFALIFFIWLWVITRVVCEPKADNFTDRIFDRGSELQLLPKWSWEFPLGIILSVFIAMIYTYFLSKYGGKYVVYIGMFFTSCMIFLVPILIMTKVLRFDWLPPFIRIIFEIIFLISLLAYLIMATCSAYHVDKETIYGIIKDTCRVLRCCPSISIFACLMSVIIIFILIFSIYMALLILFDESMIELLLELRTHNKTKNTFNMELYTHLYCSMTLILFLMNFTQIVIAGYVMDWFWSKDLDVGSLNMKRSLGRVLNFHMGSVAFYSILPIPQVWSLYQLCRRRDSDGDIVKRYNVFTRFCGQLRVFWSVIDFGMIQTSIYGYESRTSITAAHDLVAQNNQEFYLAVSGISDIFIVFGLIITATPFLLEKMSFCIYAVTFPFYILMATAVRTLIVNKMIINYTSDALKDDEEEEEKSSSVQAITVL